MIYKLLKSSVLLFSLMLIFSCSNDEINTSDVKINDFVWKGMNSWYNWQNSVPNLLDSKENNNNEYNAYLNSYETPEALFESLLYQPGTTDRFSWFIEDYEVQQQQFQGISTSLGAKFSAVKINDNGDIVLYIKYVVPNSPASDVNIQRGDIINKINGIVLNESNYSTTIGGIYEATVTLGFATESGGVLTDTEDKTLSAIVLAEDPIYYQTIFNDIEGKKVGYLVYNGFKSSYNDELNAAFATFKAEAIDELILDLRYNGGGSVATSAYLASMIYADAATNVFADLKFNSKHSSENGQYPFYNNLDVYNSDGDKTGQESINRLNSLTRLYVLTSSGTASASEMIINGLKAYIPVKVIGTTTYGKNVGSITLYDSPSSDYTNVNSANTNHKNAMQPIVFQIYNKNGDSDYIQGFVPDIEIKEFNYWNNILPFGNENEVVLKAALDDIRGYTTKSTISSKLPYSEKFRIPDFNKFEKEMFITEDFLKN